MSEQTQVAAPVQPTTLTVAQAAQRYAESKNPVSDAARTLGQRGAEARAQSRLASTTSAQESSEEEEQQPANELSQGTDGSTDDTAQPTETETNQDEPASQTIDLGDGVIATADEVREWVMLKADHTRKTQDLAEMRKGLEAKESQKLALLDNVIGGLQQQLGQPKELDALVEEYGAEEGLKKYAQQDRQIKEIQRAQGLRKQAEQQRYSESLDLRDKQLAESYNKEWSDPAKRDADYTKLTAYALKLGADPEEIRHMTKPWMIQVLHKASQHDALESGKPAVMKVVNGKPQVVKPGAKVSAQAQRHTGIQQATQRLKSSGSIADGAALLRAMRGGS